MAHAEHHEHVGDQADGGDGAGLGDVHADGVRQIGRQVGEHGVEADRIQHAGSEADDQGLEMVVEEFGERGEHAALGNDLAVSGGGALGLKSIVH